MSKYIKKLSLVKKRRKRGVVRTIDFLVSFTLFILLVTQFFLIIINLNLNIAIKTSAVENPAEQLAMKILSSPGTPNWGTSTGNPTLFGLASDTTRQSSNYYLDLAKLSRINSEVNFLSVSSQYGYVDPNTVASGLTDPVNRLEFRISTKPLINVMSSASINAGVSTITVTAMNWENRTLSNMDVEVYHVSMTDGSTLAPVQTTTDITGKAIINTNLGANTNYIAVIYVYSGISWGISWQAINNFPGTAILPTGISSFMVNKPDRLNNSLFQFSNNTLDNNVIRTNTAYFNPNTNNLTIPTTTNNNGALINTTLTSVGTNNPVIQVHVLDSNPNYYYRVLTLPLILDNTNYTSPSNSNFDSSQYPVYKTNGFSSGNLEETHVFSAIAQTDRGYLIVTIEVYEY